MKELAADKDFFEKILLYLPANEANEHEAKEKPKRASEEKNRTDDNEPPTDAARAKPQPQPQLKFKPKPKAAVPVRPGFEGTKVIKKKRNQ